MPFASDPLPLRPTSNAEPTHTYTTGDIHADGSADKASVQEPPRGRTIVSKGGGHEESLRVNEQASSHGSGSQIDHRRRSLIRAATYPPLGKLVNNVEKLLGEQEKDCVADTVEGISNENVSIYNFPYNPIPSSEAVAKGQRKLDFRPAPIRNWSLTLACVFFMSCAGMISWVIAHGLSNGGSFHIRTSRSYMIFRYLPTALGTLTTVWFRSITSTLSHLTPYISLAAEFQQNDDIRLRVMRTVANRYADNISASNPISIAQNRHWLLFSCVCVQFLMEWSIVPMKAALLQVSASDGGWNVLVFNRIGYVLISEYAFLAISTVSILARLWNRETGIKWKPSSIIDQLALVERSNILPLYRGLEFEKPGEFKEMLEKRSHRFGVLRLGYWKHAETGSIWHGIACIPPPPSDELFPVELPKEGSAYERNIECLPRVRFRSVHPALYDNSLTFVAVVLVSVLALIIAGLASHWIQKAFDASLTASTMKSLPISAINPIETVRYHLSPVLLMSFFSWFWGNVDWFYRVTQPYAGMYHAAPAPSNLMLDYPSCPAVLITIKALKNHHWRVALFSAISLLSVIPPVVANGVFNDVPTSTGFSYNIQRLNFWVCFVALIIYLVALVVARPTPAYRLPRAVQTFSDVLSYCYASHIHENRPDRKSTFSIQEVGQTKRDLESQVYLAKNQYEFGFYRGIDGCDHLGFDYANRVDAKGRQIKITKYDPGWGFRCAGSTAWFKDPQEILGEGERSV